MGRRERGRETAKGELLSPQDDFSAQRLAQIRSLFAELVADDIPGVPIVRESIDEAMGLPHLLIRRVHAPRRGFFQLEELHAGALAAERRKLSLRWVSPTLKRF